MTAGDLLELLRERPFKPLRLHLTDGRVREIPQPNMALVGVPSRRDSRIAARTFSCALSSIARVERAEREDDPAYLADTLAWL